MVIMSNTASLYKIHISLKKIHSEKNILKFLRMNSGVLPMFILSRTIS